MNDKEQCELLNPIMRVIEDVAESTQRKFKHLECPDGYVNALHRIKALCGSAIKFADLLTAQQKRDEAALAEKDAAVNKHLEDQRGAELEATRNPNTAVPLAEPADFAPGVYDGKS